MRNFLCISLLLFLSACGYHLGPGSELSKYSTVSVPYVGGDSEGTFTSILIDELSSSGPLSYVSSEDGDLRLEVKITGSKEENIGFELPKQVSGGKERLVPSEKRLKMLVVARLIDNQTGDLVMEPVYLVEGVDFDFLPIGGAAENVLEFSLGQLDSEEGARAFVSKDIYRKLAKSVVYYLYSLQ